LPFVDFRFLRYCPAGATNGYYGVLTERSRWWSDRAGRGCIRTGRGSCGRIALTKQESGVILFSGDSDHVHKQSIVDDTMLGRAATLTATWANISC
jgi:hypothetical protein